MWPRLLQRQTLTVTLIGVTVLGTSFSCSPSQRRMCSLAYPGSGTRRPRRICHRIRQSTALWTPVDFTAPSAWSTSGSRQDGGRNLYPPSPISARDLHPHEETLWPALLKRVLPHVGLDQTYDCQAMRRSARAFTSR